MFNPNTGKSGPEKTPYLDTFLAVDITLVFIFTPYYEISTTFIGYH